MFDELKSDIKNIKRFKEILTVFFEEGFDYVINKTPLKEQIPINKRIKQQIIKNKEKSFPVKLRRSFERLGPTFIKFGQILSMRPDLVSEEYIIEFEKMLDHVPPFSIKESKKIIEQELGKPITQIFKEFEETPIASGSLAQVHKAKLKNGKKVAIKVQRPNIGEIINSDTQIMLYITKIIDKHFNHYNFKIEPIVQEFARWTKKELNFYIEAMHAERFRENFKGSQILYIPKVYEDYTTKKILTIEYIDGIEINQVDRIKRSKINIDKMLKNGCQSLILQIFEHGFFHADPHPGNLFVMKDSKLAMVDFGIVGEFDKKLRHKCLNISLGILKKDLDRVARNVLSLKQTNSNNVDIETFKRSLRDAMAPIQAGTLKKATFSQTLNNLVNLTSEYKLKIPIDFILFGKTMMILEGIGLKYNPNFPITQETAKIFKKMVKEKYYPSRLFEDLKSLSYEIMEIEDEIPQYTRDVLERLKSGRINVDIENNDVNSFVNEMEKFSGNLSFGIIIGALVIGSSLVFTLEQFRYLAILGFVCAITLSFWLIKRTVLTEQV